MNLCRDVNLRKHVSGYASKNYVKHTHPNAIFRFFVNRFFRKFHDFFGITNTHSVLEIGCGEGFVLDFLAKRRPSLHLNGIDSDIEAIRFASRISASTIDFVCADGAHLPSADHSFDTVVLSEVLEHVPDPDQLLKEALRVSRRYLLITLPREPYFRMLAKCFEVFGIAEDPDHVHFWTRREFQDWIRSQARVIRYETQDFYQLALCEKFVG
jgi:2-polyprenyl-3-methyl-5-hydroxy-6-metoxy-1,4-benzoquinol methylase